MLEKDLPNISLVSFPSWLTLQPLFTFADEVLESKCEVDVVYMDFKKALDSVSHNHLLSKLEALGIAGKVLKWLEGINELIFNLCNILSEVPQGSVLGPLLFAIFIN